MTATPSLFPNLMAAVTGGGAVSAELADITLVDDTLAVSLLPVNEMIMLPAATMNVSLTSPVRDVVLSTPDLSVELSGGNDITVELCQ